MEGALVIATIAGIIICLLMIPVLIVRSDLRATARNLAESRARLESVIVQNANLRDENRVLHDRADRLADQIIAMANHPATRPDDGNASQAEVLKLFSDTIISALYGPGSDGDGEPANGLRDADADGGFIALGLDDEVRMDLGEDIDDYDEIDTDARFSGVEEPGEIDL